MSNPDHLEPWEEFALWAYYWGSIIVIVGGSFAYLFLRWWFHW